LELDLIFLKKNAHARIVKFSLLFLDIHPLQQYIYFIVLESYQCQQHKWFYPGCVASPGHHIFTHHQFEISVLLGSPSLAKTIDSSGLFGVHHYEISYCSTMH
jgi:hypothetical protein